MYHQHGGKNTLCAHPKFKQIQPSRVHMPHTITELELAYQTLRRRDNMDEFGIKHFIFRLNS